MVEQEKFTENYSDDEVDQGAHNKLLSAVSRIYKKQRVDKPKRSEPYTNVSEYHLSNYDSNETKKEKVQVFDLVNVLDRKTTHQKIKSKFDSVKDRSSKLPKPLEKVYADRIKRSVGYEHLKQHVSRWNELIQQNRTAPQLSFPLQEDIEIKEYRPLEFLHTFKEPTELEKNMAEVLQQSSVAQLDSQVEEAIYNLSIPEMIEKRKLMAKLKAKESFQIVKAMKQNKIKSKKYRRILRKEKLKQELKDFETLQRTDPEAALEKLNKLEKERAEERASLRHRNTGKWARGQAIRARYDKDARILLAEQISKSREITRKRKLPDESSSEEENEEEDEVNEDGTLNGKQAESKEQDDNPWTQEEQEQTVDDFVAGYQSYWKNKKNQPQIKPTVNKAALARLIGKDNKKTSSVNNDQNESNVDKSSVETKTNNSSINDKEVSNDESLSDEEINSFKNSLAKLKSTVTKNANDESSSESEDEIAPLNTSKTNKTVEKSLPLSKASKSDGNNENVTVSSKKNKSNLNVSSTLDTTLDNISESQSLENNDSVKKSKSSDKLNKSKDNVRTPLSKNKRKSVELRDKKTTLTNISGSWEVTPEKPANKGKKTLDDIFDKMEGDMQDRVRERLKKFDEVPSDNEIAESIEVISKKKNKLNKDVSKKAKPDVAIIEETTGKESENRDEELDNILKVIEDDNQNKTDDKEKSTKEPAIDPNKFLNVKPRVLNAQIPDMLTEGDDIIDDPEDSRRVNISEAFAEDDVVEEFRKEKEDEVKNSEGQDVNLFLPGWGSWGGPSTEPSKVKRKKKRFFVKAPELKRRDASKPNVIINEDISDKYKTHLVNEIPYPFTSVRDYEASIRAPIGSTWVPEAAVNKLTRPPVVRKIGKIIEPMTEASLVKHSKKKSSLKVTNFTRSDGNRIK